MWTVQRFKRLSEAGLINEDGTPSINATHHEVEGVNELRPTGVAQDLSLIHI